MRESKGLSFVKRTLGKITRNKTPPSTAGSSPARPNVLSSSHSIGDGTSVYSEKLEDFSKALAGQPIGAGEYPMLKLNDNLSVALGDSFEGNPSADVEDTVKFDYGPVRDPKVIRLLLIFPAAGPNDVLETIMFHADLEEVPFQALSHTCLDKGKLKRMHCNGRGLVLGESMYQALLDVRNVAEPGTFTVVWAEAVCIDQEDVRDRERHLRLVRDIFTSAKVTLAHLGGTDEESALAFETVDKLHEACKYDEFRDRLEQDEIDLSSLGHLCIKDDNLEIPPENRLELTRLFSHHWFERIWNWQEVGLSKKVCIMYGGAVRPWGYIADAAWCMYQLRWETSVADDCLAPGYTRDDLKHYHILHLDEHRDGALQGNTFSLLGLLTESRHFAAAHPLDRVFALYSHIGNSRERDIVEAFFDYTLPRLDLYLNVTLNCILSHRTLDVLHLAHNAVDASALSWPSFVPDLALHKDNTRMLGSPGGRRTWEYHAAGDTAPQLTILNHPGTTREGIPWFSDDVHILLKGLAVDEVVAVGTEMKGPTLGSHSFLADWVNTALMTEGDKFYTAPELKRARELLHSTMKESRKIHEPSSSSPAGGTWVAQRASLAGSSSRRLSSGGGGSAAADQSRSYLRSTFAPSLIAALQKLDIDADAGDQEQNGGVVDPLATLPHTRQYPLGELTVVEAFWRTLIRNRDENGRSPDQSMGQTHFAPWFRAMAGSISTMLEALAHGQSEESGIRPEPLFNDLVHMSCNGTRIARTARGLIGTVPRSAKPGDLVCILYGGETPFVLRRDEREEGTLYRFVGDCYVHGLMDGEALGWGLEEHKFELY
ncbi:Heterokaryon incompatibility protein 6, OR allele-like protein [Hapsidospora chrysogenum ATCC 11550]|uniref:Heterokaryon incompatibility protein 6, OR allele-like protein n=1 Tax=Hapsidospora chrysogenum (strain ATCC 11550 / CBS 779.69 / DSM 880 / IAM 14645 / JCM 23072 / IMI 49137) TaxID=857340 RepID=A0A086SU74_HAPC1|nr:Heterokaryon incompatibility protein 6, OR allele-like protein [Hapsidospora chrysogenum ATCC 11550]